MDACWLVVGRVPELWVPRALGRVDVIDALRDDGTSPVELQRAQLMPRLGKEGLGIARPPGIVPPLFGGPAPGIALPDLRVIHLAVLAAIP